MAQICNAQNGGLSFVTTTTERTRRMMRNFIQIVHVLQRLTADVMLSFRDIYTLSSKLNCNVFGKPNFQG